MDTTSAEQRHDDTTPTPPSRVVLKFGGTSVSSRENWDIIASVLRQRVARNERPVVVCSALSGVSNALEWLLSDAVDGKHREALTALEAQHRAMGAALGVDADAVLAEDFAALRRLAEGISLLGERSPRVHARVLARGELMSTRLGAAFLNAQGLATRWFDARDVLTSERPAAQQREYLSAVCAHAPDPALQRRLDAAPQPVALTQGFIARNRAGETVLLGRGGSDTSAAYFAAKLEATRCEIWTDVPGMFTANPRTIPNARLLRHLDYDEAQEIASTGAKVLHPRCIAPLRTGRIPLVICCTQHPALEGTRIGANLVDETPQVKAISVKSGVTLISMETLGMWQQVGFLADAFACFKAHGLSIDLVSTSEANVTVSLDPQANALAKDTLDALIDDLNAHCKASVIHACAAVSLVGRRIRAIMHRLGPAFELFEEQRIHLISQAASDLNLTFVIDDSQADRLVRRLHWLLFLDAVEDGVIGPSWQTLFSEDRAPHTDPNRRPWWWHRREHLLELAADGPCYVYNAATIRDAAGRLAAMTHVNRCFYAVKANNHPDVLRTIERAGLGFECVSPWEIDHVLDILPDLTPDRLLFTPNFAPRDEYVRAFEHGTHVTLDNLHPLEAWPEVFTGRCVLLRLDPGQGRGHHRFVKTAGAKAKFGVALDQLPRLKVLLQRHDVGVFGLHAHTGSGVRTPDNWIDTARFLVSVAAEHFPDCRVFNLGGGLGVPEKPNQPALDLSAVDASLAEIHAAHEDLELWLEPGRYLVAQAGVLLARVTQLKTKGTLRYIGVETGMNSLIRPALYGAYHEIINLSRVAQPLLWTANIVGPICESGDTLGYARPISPSREGDVLLIDTAGAYGRVMSSEYNLRPPAREEFI